MDALIYTELQPMSCSVQVELTKLRYLLGNLHADQIFLTSAEAKGESLDPVKHV